MLTKERVFQIMGKYYGNAYYRSAIVHDIPEEDLALTAAILDKVNALGYYFSNMHRMTETEDRRFVPIILESFQDFISPNYRSGLIQAICFPSYHEFVPQLLAIYEETESAQVRYDISQALFQIRSRKYIPEYLRIVNKLDYGTDSDYPHDFLIDLLCKLRVKEVVPRLLELLDRDPFHWRWTFLQYSFYFREPALLPYIEPYLASDDGELRQMAKKAIKKLQSTGAAAL